MPDNTASLVVALSAQLTKFEKDMREAGIMADKAVNDIEQKFSRMNPSLVVASFFGNLFSNLVTKGIESAIKALTEFYDRFILIDKEARILGESMKDVFAFQEVAKAGGATIEEATKSLRNLATLLAQMQRGDKNSLSELFDQNPAALRGINRETLTLQQTLQIVANLIDNTAKGVEKIEVGKLAGLSEDTALSLGKAGAALTAMQAAAAGTAPNLDNMNTRAKQFDEYMKSAAGWAKASAASVISALLNQPLRQDVPRALLTGTQGLKTEAERRAEGRLGPEGPPTKLPPRGGGGGPTASDYDRTTKSIEKQIAAMEAEAATVGQTAYEQEEYKVQLLLTNAATEQGLQWTAKLNDEIAVTAERAARASQALYEEQLALSRLQSASNVLGSALSTAFSDAIVEGKALNEVMKSLVKTLEKSVIDALVKGVTTSLIGGLTGTVLKAQGGTNFSPGGMTLVGESGPELVNLPRGSQVMPNDVSRQVMGGGGQIVYSPMIDARGASVEAVARLAQIIEQDKQTFALRTVATIQQARRGRVPGL